MDILKAALPAIKPLIKPAFEKTENIIIESMNKVTPEEGSEIALMIVIRNNRLVVLPAEIDQDNKINISEKLNNEIIQPQELVPYLLKNVNESLKNN